MIQQELKTNLKRVHSLITHNYENLIICDLRIREVNQTLKEVSTVSSESTTLKYYLKQYEELQISYRQQIEIAENLFDDFLASIKT